MINKQLLDILCCPETRQPLRLVDAPLLEQLNRQIAAGHLRNRSGQPVRDPLQAGLIREDGKRVYPIREGVPILLIDEGVVWGEESGSKAATS